MPKIDDQKKLENFIKSRRIVEMRDLFEVIQSTSRMTVFRRLSGIDYLCSYSHAGRYYTHKDIPQFNMAGLWFYEDIGFSQNGSLKNTVIFLIRNSDVGKFHLDLERQLRVRVHNVLLDLVKSAQIERIKSAGRYLYLSIDKAQSIKQNERRNKLLVQARRVPDFISESMVIEILAEVIRQSKRHPRVDKVAKALEMRGLPVSEDDVMTVFDQYDIEKKTPDSH